MIDKISQVDSTVLITGESGTGKGLIAKYIHENSNRSKEKFIEINCSAIPETLFESELFGYESGAFTGAKKEGKPGILEKANKGTLFLDEIGDLPMHMQVKLLKVLENKQLTRVGSVTPINVDIRIIAATNKDLETQVKDNNFRVDLFYRLNVFPVIIPPLRERKEDIYTLLQHFLSFYNKKFNSNVNLSLKAQNKVVNYSWPGNVRELDHFIERLVLINDGFLDANDFDIERNMENKEQNIIVNKLLPLKQAIEETERQLIEIATKISDSSYDVAELLEVSQSSAYRKMLKYQEKF
jgi:transcriptional regulator with PAS, ATPase and Fis domain